MTKLLAPQTLRHTVRAAAGWRRWHLSSAEGARRNALVASTALAERRRELHDVETFLAEHRQRFEARAAGGARTA